MSSQQSTQKEAGLGSSLRRLKATSRDRRTGRQRQAPPMHSAATSHGLNDRYMQDMEDALRDMCSKENIDSAPRAARKGAGGNASGRPKAPRKPQAIRALRPAAGVEAAGVVDPAPTSARDAAAWRAGPRDRQGTALDLSDRPSLCMDVRGDCAVIGSSDHALYEVNFRKGKRTRKLYSRAHGHAEWVNAVRYLPDGRVLSAGLDSKLFLWHASAVRATELKGHTHSVSAIEIGAGGSLACSCSYDKTVRLWDVSGPTGRECETLRGHKAPVMEVAFGDGSLISGSRDGALLSWDVQRAKLRRAEGAAHQGHITALCLAEEGETLVLSGGQDGCLRGWDPRLQGCLFERFHHRKAGGAGAVGAIRRAADGTVLTMGADMRICASDPRMSFERVSTIATHEDFIYSMELAGDLVVSGSGDGKLMVHDFRKGSLLYELGGNQNAVRAIGVADQCLVTTGDDGNAVFYSMG